MSDQSLRKAILAYRLRRAWQATATGHLSADQETKLNEVATPAELEIVTSGFSVVDVMEFMAGGISDDEEIPVEKFVEYLEHEAGEEDCDDVAEHCAVGMNLFARTYPAMFAALAAGLSAEDEADLYLLEELAPALVSALRDAQPA